MSSPSSRALARLSRALAALLLLSCACGPARAAAPRVSYRSEPHVGEEVVLEAEPSSIPPDASIEWSVGGDAAPIWLRAGGRECAFVPRSPTSIDVSATVRDASGAPIGTVELTVVPKEFAVEIAIIEDAPTMLWDALEKRDAPAGALLAGRTVRLRAELVPPFKDGQVSLVWEGDASTALTSADLPSDVLMQRSEIGESEVRVAAFNAAGSRLGAGTCVVSVGMPASVAEGAERAKGAWHAWQEAQGLWARGEHDRAVELAQRAQADAPRDPDIAVGVKGMSADHARYLKASASRQRAEAQRAEGKLDDALKSLRVAQVVWPTPEGERAISDMEKEIDALRARRQRAEWLRDMASAYDQEGLWEDAIERYAQSAALVPSEAIEDRIGRIRNRLSLIAEADRYAGEGSALEREGKLQEAIAHYSASIVSNPDAALRQHITELQGTIDKRKRQAGTLYREGQDLQKKGDRATALVRFRESLCMWETPEAHERVAELEAVVSSDAPPREPEDFGIGTRADAARLVRAGDALYIQRRTEEAVALYRKSLTISDDAELREWIAKLEEELRGRKAALAADALAREGHALLREGKTDEALAKYRESLAAHPNAELAASVERLSASPKE